MISSHKKFGLKSREAKIKQLALRFHELFNDIKEISVFEVDTNGFIKSNLQGGRIIWVLSTGY